MSTIYVPAQLRRAISSLEIDLMLSLMSQIAKHHSETVPAFLYHYTDGNGLRGILESGSLWFTDIFSLNDPTELRHGIDDFLVTMRKCMSESKQDFGYFLQNIEEALSEDSVLHHFICSFSQTGDDLGQWRAYADDGHGYALAFDGEILYNAWSNKKKKVNVHKIKGGDDGMRLAFPIIYDHDLLNDISNQIITKSLEVLALTTAPGVKAEAARIYQDRITPKIVIRVILLSVLFKHHAYKTENEFRFLQLLFTKSLLNIKYRSRPYTLVRYLEWNWRAIAPKALRKIIVGPTADWGMARQFAADCLRAFHPVRDIEIIASEIPYRGPIS